MCRLSWYLGPSTSFNPQDLYRSVMEFLCLYPSHCIFWKTIFINYKIYLSPYFLLTLIIVLFCFIRGENNEDLRVVVWIDTDLFLWIFFPEFTGCVDKSLARPTSRYILFDVENISFDASLFIYINSNNIPQIMIINRIYEYQIFCCCCLFPSWTG